MTTWTYLSDLSGMEALDFAKKKTAVGWETDMPLPSIGIIGVDVYRYGFDVVVGNMSGQTNYLPAQFDQQRLIEIATKLLFLAAEDSPDIVGRNARQVAKYCRARKAQP